MSRRDWANSGSDCCTEWAGSPCSRAGACWSCGGRGRCHRGAPSDHRPGARDGHGSDHPVCRVSPRRDVSCLRCHLGDRGRPGDRRAAVPDHHRADPAASAFGVPDSGLRVGERGLRPHRAGAPYARPCDGASRALARGCARGQRDTHCYPGGVGFPVVGGLPVAPWHASSGLAGPRRGLVGWHPRGGAAGRRLVHPAHQGQRSRAPAAPRR